MLLKLFSRAAMAVAKKIGIFKSNGTGKNNITDDYEIVDEPTSCEVFPYREHQPNSFDNSTDDETVKDDNHADTTDDRSVTTKDSPSVSLSTRDPNQTESETIKARFDREFLPKYGSTWRKIQEKKSSNDEKDRVDTTNDHNSSASTDEGDLERSRMIEMGRSTIAAENTMKIAFETYENLVAEAGKYMIDDEKDWDDATDDHNSFTSADEGDLKRSRMIEMIEMGRSTMAAENEDLSGTEEEGIVVDTSDEEVVSVVSVSSESSRFSNVLRTLDYDHLRTSPLFSDLRNDVIIVSLPEYQ
jgi:hypothetical protein